MSLTLAAQATHPMPVSPRTREDRGVDLAAAEAILQRRSRRLSTAATRLTQASAALTVTGLLALYATDQALTALVLGVSALTVSLGGWLLGGYAETEGLRLRRTRQRRRLQEIAELEAYAEAAVTLPTAA